MSNSSYPRCLCRSARSTSTTRPRHFCLFLVASFARKKESTVNNNSNVYIPCARSRDSNSLQFGWRSRLSALISSICCCRESKSTSFSKAFTANFSPDFYRLLHLQFRKSRIQSYVAICSLTGLPDLVFPGLPPMIANWLAKVRTCASVVSVTACS